MPFTKDDPNINRAGRPPGGVKSMRAIYREKLTTDVRERIADTFIAQAEAGSLGHYQAIFQTLGESPDSAPIRTNILAILAGTDRVLLERLFTALPLGGGDAGGLGGLRIAERGDVAAGMDALEASDVDQ